MTRGIRSGWPFGAGAAAWLVIGAVACGSGSSDGANPNGPDDGSGSDAGASDGGPGSSGDGASGDGGPGGDSSANDGAGPTTDGGSPGVASSLYVSYLDSCVLTPQGEARCWGRNLPDKPSPYAVGKTWKSLAVNVNTYGSEAVCGIRSDDSVECTGAGTPNETWNDRAYRAVTVGYPLIGEVVGQRCAIATSGALYCWGSNKVGQLGVGDTTARTSPTQVGSATDWTQVSATAAFTCGLRGAGDLYCWGINDASQLGDGTTTERHEPTAVAGGAQYKQVSTDGVGACAVRNDGKLDCWANVYGMAGAKVPTQVGTDGDWAQVAVNDTNVCGLKTNGTIFCWGANGFGQVGDGTRTNRATPTQVGTDSDWAEIGVGMFGGCARKKSGAVLCWGDNKDGQLGTGNVKHLVPTRIEPASTFKHVAATDERTCAVRANGTLACWGAPIDYTSPIQATPLAVGTDTDWKTVTLGKHACATKNDDSVYCWGVGNNGDLGLGSTSSAAAPTSIGLAASQVAISDGHACAVATDQSLYCWGQTSSRQAGGISSSGNVTTPTKIGTDKWLRVATSKRGGCAVRTDHALFCFGNSAGFAQVGTDVDWTDTSASYFDDFVMGLGGGAMKVIYLNSSNAPVVWGTETTFAKIAVMGIMFGIRTNGTLAGTGYNGNGQLGDGTTKDPAQKTFVDAFGGATDWEMVTTGFSHTCGLRHGGELYCWGDDGQGQIGDGSRYRLSPTAVVPF